MSNTPPTAWPWRACADEMPDSDEAVMIHHPENDDPVWLGFWDSACNTWREISAVPCLVTHWMPIPEGPTRRQDGGTTS